MPRKILHLDLDAFFCSVEELRDPTLKGKPFAVGGNPEQRGVVASCSYPARQRGIRSAMPMARALRLCPDLIIISSRHSVYARHSEAVMERVRNLTPLVEQVSIDEAFLDISDLPDDAGLVARRLQSVINQELSLPCSLGVATNKLVAKIANDVGKAARRGASPPNAVTIVPPGEEVEFLAPLPTSALWGVGPKTAVKLEEIGILTIGNLAKFHESELVQRFGKYGHDLYEHAHGIDESPIITYHEAKSISQEVTFARDQRDDKLLKHTLLELSEKVGWRLREAHLAGVTVKLKIRWSDFTTITRQESFSQPIDQDMQIFQAALNLFGKVWQPGKFVRLIGVGVSGLRAPIRQLSLWEDINQDDPAVLSERDRRLQQAIDDLRQRFGPEILHKGEK